MREERVVNMVMSSIWDMLSLRFLWDPQVEMKVTSIALMQEGDMRTMGNVRGKEVLDKNSRKCQHVWDRLGSRRRD